MIEVTRGVWGGWQWYVEVDGKFVGTVLRTAWTSM